MSYASASNTDNSRTAQGSAMERTGVEPGHARQDGGTSAGGPLAKGLGWFSLGLGMAQLVAPGSMARMIGVKRDGITEPVMRFIGLREIASGIGILSGWGRTNWLRGRVGSDLIDLALLGTALRSDVAEPPRLVGATVAVAGVTALDVLATRASRGAEGANRLPEVRAAITVARPVQTVYAYWRDFSNLPRFMEHLQSVESTGEGHTHWVTKAPLGRTVEWDAEVVSDVPNELIAWRSLPGSQIDSAGMVQFKPAPGDRGTEIHVSMRYTMPGGKVGATLSKIFAENPDREVYDDLRAFKQQMETGEVLKSDAILAGGRLKQRPAQPLKPSESPG